jgi:hypothetical protein
MSLDVGDSPSDRSDEWRITHIGRRAKWVDERESCTNCGTSVWLDSRHYYVTLSKETASTVKSASDEELVFCGKRCLDRWRRER